MCDVSPQPANHAFHTPWSQFQSWFVQQGVDLQAYIAEQVLEQGMGVLQSAARATQVRATLTPLDGMYPIILHQAQSWSSSLASIQS